MGKMQRTKGKVGERELAGLLRQLTGRDVQRRVRQHDSDSDLLGLEPWIIECKRAKVLRLNDWWPQAKAQQGEDGRPALMWRKDGIVVWTVRCKLADILDTMSLRQWCDPDVVVDMTLEDWVVAVGLTPRK